MTTKLDNKLLKELISEAIEEMRTDGRGFTAKVMAANPDLDPYRDPAAFPAMSKMQKLRKALQQASLKGAENMTPEEIEQLEHMLAVVTGTAADAMAKGVKFETKEETLEEKIARLTREELEIVLNEKKKKKKKKSAKDRMKCNSPRRIRKGEAGHGKKKFVVKACDGGTEKIIRYGDANMEIKKDSPKRRKSFRARHNCKNPGSKLKARYWSCKKW